MSESMKGAMIGAGFFAEFQADGWRRIDAADVTAVADPLPGKAREFAEKHGIRNAYESVDEMLDAEEPDFVDVATRPDSHLDLVKNAARRGINIICQKPMAPTWEESVEMVGFCKAMNVRLLIHENWRWQPWYREIRRVIDAGQIGERYLTRFSWRTGDGVGPEPYAHQPYFREMPRLLIYESLVHLLDTFRFLVGEVESLTCSISRKNPVIAGEDQATIELLFENGLKGVIDGDRTDGPSPAPVAMGWLKIDGEAASLNMTADGKVTLNVPGVAPRELDFDRPESGYKGESVLAAQEHYAECLKRGTPCESEGADYLKTVRLVEACYEAAAKGARVTV